LELHCLPTHFLKAAYTRIMFIEDDKLSDDVVRKKYSDTRHSLCCLNCGCESEFDPTVRGSIGRPLHVLLEHDCKKYEN